MFSWKALMDHELQPSLMKLSSFVHLSLMEVGSEVVAVFEVRCYAMKTPLLTTYEICVTHFLVFFQPMNCLLSTSLKFLLSFLLIMFNKLLLLQGADKFNYTQFAHSRLTI